MKTNEILYETKRKTAQYFNIIKTVNNQRTEEQINYNILLKPYFLKVILINIFYQLIKKNYRMNK